MIKQYVLAGATVEEIETLTADSVRTMVGDAELKISKPRLANTKRFALAVFERNQRNLIKQGFADQFGGKRSWLANNYPNCEFDIDDELGKPCVKIYPEGKP